MRTMWGITKSSSGSSGTWRRATRRRIISTRRFGCWPGARRTTSTRGSAIRWRTPFTARGGRRIRPNGLPRRMTRSRNERKVNEWNAKLAATSLSLDEAPSSKSAAASSYQANETTKRTMEMEPYTTRLAEILAKIKTNQAKKELSELDAKIEFQALLVQLFLQRRFQHVLIGTRFYRAVFTDGDTSLKIGKDANDIFANSSGMPPTVGTMDSMANEIIRDVREGVQAFQYLLTQNELQSATNRLAEAFTTGEYLPEIRTLPRAQKRQALQFEQKSDQLVSALEVKDYTLAEKLVDELSKTATDFDTSKATAAIETAKQVSALHLAKARNAALSGDRATLEEELKEATEIWPRNPDLTQISEQIFLSGRCAAEGAGGPG